jgi:Zn finger protein HypA/HybF involved in hydrogenase expression
MVTSLYKTLEQELHALARGISLECLVCGEFVLRTGRTISCPECGSHLRMAGAQQDAGRQADLPVG